MINLEFVDSRGNKNRFIKHPLHRTLNKTILFHVLLFSLLIGCENFMNISPNKIHDINTNNSEIPGAVSAAVP
jgi:hypothetical protein